MLLAPTFRLVHERPCLCVCVCALSLLLLLSLCPPKNDISTQRNDICSKWSSSSCSSFFSLGFLLAFPLCCLLFVLSLSLSLSLSPSFWHRQTNRQTNKQANKQWLLIWNGKIRFYLLLFFLLFFLLCRCHYLVTLCSSIWAKKLLACILAIDPYSSSPSPLPSPPADSSPLDRRKKLPLESNIIIISNVHLSFLLLSMQRGIFSVHGFLGELA